MIETVKLLRISATNKKKDGTILKNKFGEFFRVGIQVEGKVDDFGEPVWINGFLKHRPTWNVDDEIQVEIVEEEYNGKKQLNFRLPKKESVLEDKVKQLEQELASLKPKEADIDGSF